MAPLIESNTPRVKTKYRAFGLEHTVITRYSRGTTGAAAQTQNAAFWDGIMASFPDGMIAADFQWLSVDFAPEDSNVFNPAGTLPSNPSGTVLTTAISRAKWATHTKFNGRGGGRNYSFELFGILWADELPTDDASDGLVTSLESPEIQQCLVVLSSSSLVTIANIVAAWKPRANIKVNDYWRDELKQ